MNNTAYLSNNGRCISFKYDNKNIRFIGPKSLERFVEVKTWDKGYLVVNVKYTKHEELIEDYIDLNDILKKLYIDNEDFLKPIEKVEIEHV